MFKCINQPVNKNKEIPPPFFLILKDINVNKRINRHYFILCATKLDYSIDNYSDYINLKECHSLLETV